MRQGTEYVYVKCSLELFKQLGGEWSRPVVLQMREEYDGTIEIVTKDVARLSLKELAAILND